jgi:hypothetical protein
VTEFGRNPKGGSWTNYKFSVNGKEYEGSYGAILSRRCFPVIYAKNNPDYNAMLVSEDDFERYNLPFPNSLHHALPN